VIHKFTVRPRDGVEAPAAEQLRSATGLHDLAVWRDYYVEVDSELSPEQVAAVRDVLADGVVDECVHAHLVQGPGMVQVSHRSGVVDNENDSIVTTLGLLGIAARAGKMASTYVSSAPDLVGAVESRCFNPNTDELHLAEPRLHTLMPLGQYLPAEHYDLRNLDDGALGDLGRAGGRNLDLRQMHHIRGVQEATGASHVTDALLEALDARWSDHCSHTTWRSHGNLLKRLVDASRSTANANVVSMFHDNAGVWDFYDGWAIALKAETHNGPSAVSAYFGQLTKLGGVLRDILGTGQGADPIGCFEYTATGLPEQPAPLSNRPTPKQIALDTVRAIKEYGNTFGVPMMWSHMTFHPRYRAKPFALGGCIGLIPRSAAQRGMPTPGDMVVLIGGRTGNDGIHGASASSAGATMEGAAVQIGAPLEEVKFRKAIVELRDAGCVRALTDLGAAGLNSAVGEIGEACGVWINTALVPLKTSGLPMWRILLSESQERMVVVVAPDRLTEARSILGRHQVRCAVIGRFVDNGRYRVLHDPELSEAAVVSMAPGGLPGGAGEQGFDIPYSLLDDELDQVRVEPALREVDAPLPFPAVDLEELQALVLRLVSDPEIASQELFDSQYDTTVQGNTIYGPHFGSRVRVPSAYWAATPVVGSRSAVLVATAFDPWLFEVQPVRALRQLYCRLLGTLVLAGADLEDICVCDNFYTPHLEPDAGTWLVAMVDELASLVRAFGTPVISGKDSSAGSTRTDEGVVSVPPAVFLTGLGKVPDRRGLLPEEWRDPGSLIVRIGPTFPSATGTTVARAMRLGGGTLDDVAIGGYRDYLLALCRCRRLLRSGTPIGAGGTLARLLLCGMAGGVGIDVAASGDNLAHLLTEHRCGALVEIGEADLGRLPSALAPVVIGRVSATPGVRIDGHEALTAEVVRAWSNAFEERLG
jgi:phosphoribosylformylglycinamidine synthase